MRANKKAIIIRIFYNKPFDSTANLLTISRIIDFVESNENCKRQIYDWPFFTEKRRYTIIKKYGCCISAHFFVRLQEQCRFTANDLT